MLFYTSAGDSVNPSFRFLSKYKTQSHPLSFHRRNTPIQKVCRSFNETRKPTSNQQHHSSKITSSRHLSPNELRFQWHPQPESNRAFAVGETAFLTARRWGPWNAGIMPILPSLVKREFFDMSVTTGAWHTMHQAPAEGESYREIRVPSCVPHRFSPHRENPVWREPQRHTECIQHFECSMHRSRISS